MVETEIKILINRKSDIELIEQIVINRKIQYPILIIEFESYFNLSFTSNYEEWELESAILECFPNYEFTSNIENGKKEIRLQLLRYQSDLSMDDWGRPIENPIKEAKYLIKKSSEKTERFYPKVKVLFEDKNKFYFINIADGINKASGEKGFLLIKNFNSEYTGGEADVFKDKIYTSLEEAFYFGCIKLKQQADYDFEEYIDNKNKELQKQQKRPRKIIRDFIDSCNTHEIKRVIEHLDTNLTFDIITHWQRQLSTKGLNEFVDYLKLSNQQLCSREIKIKSWIFNSSSIKIGIKFIKEENLGKKLELYGKIVFLFKGEKIISITIEN